jgi:hypothetical protein
VQGVRTPVFPGKPGRALPCLRTGNPDSEKQESVVVQTGKALSPGYFRMKYTMSEVARYFKGLGWQKGRKDVNSSCDERFYTRFPGYPECGTKPGKGILVYANVYDYTQAPVSAIAIELHLLGQIRDEQWVDLHVYSIDSLDKIPVCCERLLKAWKTMNEITVKPE